MFSEDDLLPISALQHLVFCERRCALVHIEGIWQDNLFTAEGRNLHERTDAVQTESCGDTRVARSLPLRSLRLGLSGKADVVEFHRAQLGVVLPGAKGSWRLFPVEYKRGHRKHDLSFEVQLCAQAMCLEEMLETEVPAGAIFYGKSRRRQDVAFTPELRDQTERSAQRLHQLFRSGRTPAARYEKKCQSCSLMDLCLPKAVESHGRAARYLAQSLADAAGPLENRPDETHA